MRSRIRRTALAAIVVVPVAMVPAAHADSTAVTTTDGRVLVVGSVAATGTRSADVCAFADSIALVAEEHTGKVRFQVDERCRLVVSAIDTKPIPLPVPGPLSAPKVELRASVTPAGGGTPGVGGIGGGGGLGLDAVSDAYEGPDTEPMLVTLVHTFYDAAGFKVYEDAAQMQYTRNYRRETVGSPRFIDGWCSGSDLWTVTGDPVTTIYNCYYKPMGAGPTTVSFLTGGYYRQGVRAAGVDLTWDERHSFGGMEVTFGGKPNYQCYPGAEVPVYWETECFFNQV